MKYRTGFCFNVADLYETMNMKTVNLPKRVFRDTYNKRRKSEMCITLFVYCFYLILTDIIENNVTFVFPIKGADAMLHVEPVKGNELIQACQNGKFAGIDFVESEFTGYRLVYTYKTFTKVLRKKEVYMNKKFKDRLYELANAGKKYY